MKDGWSVKKLVEVCEINYGTRVVQKKDGGTIYPVYGGGGATFKMDIYNREDCLVVSRFAMSSQCVRYVRGKFFLNDSGLTVKTDNVCLSQEYLDKCILSLNDKIYSLGKGVAQKNLDMKEFRNLNIHYPISLPEQSRIVEELDLLSNIIEKKRQQLSEFDNLAQSIFYDMFGDPVTNEKGWEVKKLGEVCDVRDGTHDSPKYLEHSDYVLITSKNIVNGDIDYTSINYICEEDYNNINKRSFVEDGDIIMAMIGTIGKPIIVKRKGVNFCIKNVALIKFGKSVEVINTYIQYLLDNTSYKQYINKQNKGGTQKFIALGAIRKLDIPLPPLNLQQLFAKKIEAIEKQKALIKQSIAETEELFNSRMDYYFS